MSCTIIAHTRVIPCRSTSTTVTGPIPAAMATAEIKAIVSEEEGGCILRWTSFLWRCHGFCLID